MNAGPPVWKAHTTPEGRTYYHNAATGATQWEKPEALMTAAERALANQPWKEYTAEGGRKYWNNIETKESSWEMPEVYKKALSAIDAPVHPLPSRNSFANGPVHDGNNRDFRDRDRDRSDRNDYRDRDHRDRDRDHRDRDRDPRDRDPRDRRDRDNRPDSYRPGDRNMPPAMDIPPVFQPSMADPEFATPQEAEAAFVQLLKRSKVQPEWTYEQAVRVIAKDPNFRAIRDPRDRKAAFEKYCQEALEQDRERAKERIAKLRADFQTMLKSHDEIKHYTRWKAARAMIEKETIFRSTDNEDERRQLFIEYVIGLKKAHVEDQVNQRKAAMDGLINLLSNLDLEPYTRWADAQSQINASTDFQTEAKYQTLSKFDVLTAFQNHVKALERAFNENKQHAKAQKYRTERKNRDAFKELLSELRRDGKITASTKWSTIFPLIEADVRYTAMAGQSGSSAQDLFWDVLEEEEKGLRDLRNTILDILDDKRFEVTSKTTFDEFSQVIKDNRRVADTDNDILVLLFERLQEKKIKKSDDERYPERLQRKAAENFKAYLKRLDPPLQPSDTYEKVKSRIYRSDEFQFLYSDETRRTIFDKVQRRLKDREEEDRERDRTSKRRGDRASSDRDFYRERDRSRGDRSHRSGGGRRRSRSPTANGELDPYEADRRKAIADRERNNSRRNAESLLDGPLGGRDRERERDTRTRSRERERERDGPRPRDKERERLRSRDRERERERDHDEYRHRLRRDDYYDERDRHPRDDFRHRSRAGSFDELNYDDERPARRRRGEEEEDKRDPKRQRTVRDHTPRGRTPVVEGEKEGDTSSAPKETKEVSTVPAGKADDDVAMHSGSEEGEIEE